MLSLLWTACHREPPVEEPPALTGGIVPLQDADPDPLQFAGELVAEPTDIVLSDGTVVHGLGYNGRVPGPLIRVPLGATVSVSLASELPEDVHTTIHWHGIEGNNASDGTHTTQSSIEPGESFLYEFVTVRPGLYWYHPHVHGAQSVFSGLYAPLIVDDPDEPALIEAGVLPRTEQILVLSDISHYQGTPSQVPDDGTEVMNGTEGKLLLVNGQLQPTLEIPASGPTRLRIVNSSIARFWRLSVPGHTLYRIGGEGGLLDTVRVEGGTVQGTVTRLEDGEMVGTTEVDLGYERGEILLAPAERADVVLQPVGEPGDVLELRWEDYARGRHTMWMEDGEVMAGEAPDDGTRPGLVVARLRLVDSDEPPWALSEGDPVLGALGRSVGQIDMEGALDWTGEQAMVLSELMEHVLDEAGNLQMLSEFYVDGESWHGDHHAGKGQPEAPTAVRARLGDAIVWEARNETEMVHPLHIHGFSYQPYAYFQDDEEAGTRTTWPYGSWDLGEGEFEDTTSIPGETSLLLRMELTDPVGNGGAVGRWMRHCHLLQHGENGMMSELIVEP
jgi:FtsP/CotA-like multicopper oxidase with cupredoxin domain